MWVGGCIGGGGSVSSMECVELGVLGLWPAVCQVEEGLCVARRSWYESSACNAGGGGACPSAACRQSSVASVGWGGQRCRDRDGLVLATCDLGVGVGEAHGSEKEALGRWVWHVRWGLQTK